MHEEPTNSVPERQQSGGDCRDLSEALEKISLCYSILRRLNWMVAALFGAWVGQLAGNMTVRLLERFFGG